MNKPFGVKITRADKRGRKIILVMESDIYSDETFAVNPFGDEGDEKNQLDAIHFGIKVTEKGGKIKAEVSFGNCLNHFTKGNSQLHSSIETFYSDRKDCAMDWIKSTDDEWFLDDRIKQIANQWERDPEFQAQFLSAVNKRKQKTKANELKEAEFGFQQALSRLKKASENILK